MARRFLGMTYTWGGSSSFGYDCSGFTQMLVRSRGIHMPRDADQQAAWNGVVAIERKDLQPGDLLFFGDSDKKITHTGMYIGNGEFIHDTTNTHPMVQISRLDDEPWTQLACGDAEGEMNRREWMLSAAGAGAALMAARQGFGVGCRLPTVPASGRQRLSG